jgi:hypothetical protein
LRFSRGPSRDFLELRCPEPNTVARARFHSHEVPVPCRVLSYPTCSALLASSAPPSSLLRPRGFPRRTLSWNVSPAICPLGVRCLSRALKLRLRPLAPSPAKPPERSLSFQSLAGPPLVGFLLPRTPLRRVPLFPPLHLLAEALWGTRVAKPSPVPSSGFLPLSTVLASSRRVTRSCDPARLPWPPTLRGLLSCRSRPWSVPPELSLPGEPYPLSRALASLGFALRPPPAQSQ